jgi:hypothetical protein
VAGKLFEVAILEHPTKEEADKGVTSKLVFGPKPVVAVNEQGALVAALLSGDRPEVDMQRAQVLVRPFATSFGEQSQDTRARHVPRSMTPDHSLIRALGNAVPEMDWLEATSASSSAYPVFEASNVTYGKAPKGSNSYTGASLAAFTQSSPITTSTGTGFSVPTGTKQ